MNSIKGHIEHIEVDGSLAVVSTRIGGGIAMKAIVVENPVTVPYMKIGRAISLLFKETEVIIGHGNVDKISPQNKIPGNIGHIEKGALLSKVTIASPAGELVSVISTNAINEMGLKKGMPVTAMVKLNEVMLQET